MPQSMSKYEYKFEKFRQKNGMISRESELYRLVTVNIRNC